ncbi:MAG: hypothetical protein KIH69_003190 [Anaerolineae bacterium]|nr:hypothetical protein [Anaerolineae bacterium]
MMLTLGMVLSFIGLPNIAHANTPGWGISTAQLLLNALRRGETATFILAAPCQFERAEGVMSHRLSSYDATSRDYASSGWLDPQTVKNMVTRDMWLYVSKGKVLFSGYSAMQVEITQDGNIRLTHEIDNGINSLYWNAIVADDGIAIEHWQSRGLGGVVNHQGESATQQLYAVFHCGLTLAKGKQVPVMPASNVQVQHTQQGLVVTWESSPSAEVVEYVVYREILLTSSKKEMARGRGNRFIDTSPEALYDSVLPFMPVNPIYTIVARTADGRVSEGAFAVGQ